MQPVPRTSSRRCPNPKVDDRGGVRWNHRRLSGPSRGMNRKREEELRPLTKPPIKKEPRKHPLTTQLAPAANHWFAVSWICRKCRYRASDVLTSGSNVQPRPCKFCNAPMKQVQNELIRSEIPRPKVLSETTRPTVPIARRETRGEFTAHVIASLPEHEAMEVEAHGRGSTNRIAIVRAVREVLSRPGLKHKSPNWINLAVSTSGMAPIRFWLNSQGK